MVMEVLFSGYVDIRRAFRLLPITRLPLPEGTKIQKKKLPVWLPGSILSMRFEGETRGLLVGGSFKNAVSIDISTSQKNVGVKLTQSKIHICGTCNKDDGLEAASYVLKHLQDVQAILEQAKLNPHTLQWIQKQLQGATVERPVWRVEHFSRLTLNIYAPVADCAITYPPIPWPPEIHKEVTQYLLSLSQDFLFYSDFQVLLNQLRNCKLVYPPQAPLTIIAEEEIMVNYNFSLGFPVDRIRLSELMCGRNGFYAYYDNATVHHVTVERPYTPAPNSIVKKKKNKVPRHTFLIYASGAVTQSGPNIALMREVYYLFMHSIAEISEEIRLQY
jgi:hypothetical protein